MKNAALLLMLLCTAPIFAQEETAVRPKIGVVLGGGGALGLAHIGVLRQLEELQVPVDCIGGTSMGAIVAAMYASGLSPAEMEEQFVALDWWEVLKDRSPYPYLDYRRKLDCRRFMGTQFGLRNGRVIYSPGIAFGQKLNNVLESFTLNTAGVTDFDQLNIPCRIIATDLRSGSSVVLASGNLSECMRASMAVPGMFTPVRMNGMVLVDGGILNNIPVEAVKEAMDADIIIAVDVGASSATRAASSDFRSLGDIVSRTYALMQRPDQERQLAMADLVIAPELSFAKVSQFHRASEIVPAGYAAAAAQRDALRHYAVDAQTYAAWQAKQRSGPGEAALLITDITVTGNRTVSEAVIRDRIKTRPGPLSKESVRADLNRIHGMGDFETVTCDVIPNDEGCTLLYRIAEKSWGPTYLHFGTRVEMTTDAFLLWSLLLNYTRTHINTLGGEIQIDLEGGGRTRMARGEWYQPVSWRKRLFMAPALAYRMEEIDIFAGDNDVADAEQTLACGRMDAGLNFFEYGELRVGAMGGHARFSSRSGAIALPEVSDTVVAGVSSLRLDQLDHPDFPTRGYRLTLDGLLASKALGSSKTYSTLEGEVTAAVSRGAHTLKPRLAAGSSLGTDLPPYALFALGGLESMAGLAPWQLRGNYYGVGSLEYRLRLGRLPPTFGNGIHAFLRGDAGNAWFSSDDARLDRLDGALLVGIGADTLIGSCIAALGKAEGAVARLYLSIGNTF